MAERIDLAKPWDDPDNLNATAAPIVDALLCPARAETTTIYQAVAGPESWFGERSSRSFADDVELGATLLVTEVDPPRAVPWPKPEDVGDEFVRNCRDAETVHVGGFQGVLDDGTVRFVSVNASAEVRQALLTVGAVPGEF